MALSIKILGPGCVNCRRVEQQTLKALEQMEAAHPNLEATVQHVTDRDEIMAYPILHTPGLVINEQVVCSARIPRVDEIVGWVEQALQQTA